MKSPSHLIKPFWKVIHGLGITHVLSTSRIRASKFRGLVYILVNKVGRRNIFYFLLLTWFSIFIPPWNIFYFLFLVWFSTSTPPDCISSGLLLRLHPQTNDQLCAGGAGWRGQVLAHRYAISLCRNIYKIRLDKDYSLVGQITRQVLAQCYAISLCRNID